jgi:hypothetical protein
MKGLIVAAVAAVGLAGCVAVPYGGDPYYYGGPVYYPAPVVSFGVYGGHGFYHRHYHGRRW